MNVYKLLHEDHMKVESLFESLEDTTEKTVRTRIHLFGDLKLELTLHSEAEEKFFYPKLKRSDDSRALAEQALDEHKTVKNLLDELDRDPKDAKEWMTKLLTLKDDVMRHVRMEEDELFRKAKTQFSDDEADSIAAEIESFKESETSAESR